MIPFSACLCSIYVPICITDAGAVIRNDDMTQILRKMNAAAVSPDMLEGAVAVAMPQQGSATSGTKRQARIIQDVARFVCTLPEVEGDDTDICLALCARIFALKRWVGDNETFVLRFSSEELLECAAAEELIEQGDIPVFSNDGFRERLRRHAMPLLA